MRNDNKSKEIVKDSQNSAQLVRLNKAIAQAGICSRRKADDLILSGKVAVNGEKISSPGVKVDIENDQITVDGKPMGEAQAHVTIILNKPIQTVSSVSDPQGRTTIIDILPDKYKKLRMYPVGRLDFFSQGLILITTDGALCHELTHPSRNHDKTYLVTVREELTEAMKSTMQAGMTLEEGEKLAPVRVSVKWKKNGKTCLEMVLSQGVNRQIRRMCRDLGLTILQLKRISQGPLKLSGLKPGECRELTKQEIQVLKQSLHAR